MPHSVEMPAPVNGTTTSASSTRSRSRAIPVSMSAAIMYDTLYRQIQGAPLVLPGLLNLSPAPARLREHVPPNRRVSVHEISSYHAAGSRSRRRAQILLRPARACRDVAPP